jgi:hypothetical protein
MKALTTLLVLVTLSSCGQSRKTGWTDTRYSDSKNIVTMSCAKTADYTYCDKYAECITNHLSVNYTYWFMMENQEDILETLIKSNAAKNCADKSK